MTQKLIRITECTLLEVLLLRMGSCDQPLSSRSDCFTEYLTPSKIPGHMVQMDRREYVRYIPASQCYTVDNDDQSEGTFYAHGPCSLVHSEKK